jgi:glycosyltransferase involved in cell wall biosynthesis
VFFRRQEAVANLLSMLMFVPMGIRTGKKLLRARQYDVMNTHFVLPTGPIGHSLARFGGIPNVLSLHGGDLYDPSKFTSPHQHFFLRIWVRRLLRQANVVVGQSRNTLENMRRFYAPEIEGVQIPLGIQRPRLDAASRQHYGIGEEEVLLVTVGRLVARKAIPQLIAMMDAFREEKARLLIIGAGPQERLLKEEVRRRELDERVLFLGQVEESEKFRVLQMCDIYVSTSQHEGFGLVFLEAMASGLPVVCYDHGGQADFLENANTGYLVPLNDLSGMQTHCQQLMRDRELRRRIGQENMRRAEELFIDRCAQRYERIFQEAIEKRPLQTALAKPCFCSATHPLTIKGLSGEDAAGKE